VRGALKNEHMKTFLLWLLMSGPLFVMAQTVRTVSNNPNNLAQFNTIQAAIDASSSGDTIYVHGSPNIYSGFVINNKRLAIIGPGFAPQSSGAQTARINNSLTFNQSFIFGEASSGTEIQGLVLQGNAWPLNLLPPPSGLVFRRNLFLNNLDMYTGTYDGYIFEGNEFRNAGINTSSGVGTGILRNWIITNNLFSHFASNNLQLTNCDNVLIDHNLFFFNLNSGTPAVFASSNNLIISNNIFVRRNPGSGLSNSVFSNNITFNAGDNTPWLTGTNVDGGGNIANQDPQMVDQAAVNAGTTATAISNFRIQNGSPAKGTGTGGKGHGPALR
jgi:hypothetical protein